MYYRAGTVQEEALYKPGTKSRAGRILMLGQGITAGIVINIALGFF